MWAPRAPVALLVALSVLAADQFHKWWMLNVFDIARNQPYPITSFFDLVLVWNKGISYGFLTGLGPWPLIAGQAIITLFLWNWLVNQKSNFTAIFIAVIIGGALGNIADRLLHGAVVDIFYLHAFGYSWYVFNLADTAIVAGAVVLVYNSFADLFGWHTG
ncbi:MAG TPA: signal peptidase II, partial [Rhizobiales bacterium]|nr:signal peptidase II [Hyphomicrobiales bacterium]